MQNLKDKKLKIEYNSYNLVWESETIPLGNGILGLSINSHSKKDIITLNEESLWQGGPSDNRNYTFGNDTTKQGNDYLAYLNFQKTNQYFLANNKEKATKYSEKLIGKKDFFGAYQVLGEIEIDYLEEHQELAIKRSLDIINGLYQIERKYQNNQITKKIFVSNPNNFALLKLCSINKTNLSLSFNFKQFRNSIKYDNNNLVVKGIISDNNLNWITCIYFKTDGLINYSNNKIMIANANDVSLYLVILTNYKNLYPTYRENTNLEEKAQEIINNIKDKTYDELYKIHSTDFSSLMKRIELNIFSKNNDTLEQSFKKYQNKKYNPKLESLLFQYGRYLLISSTRENSKLPLNLQGIWNNTNTPLWSSDYHLNINLEMSYWLSLKGNLFETIKPLINFVFDLTKPGRETARIYTGINKGFLINTQANPFGWSAPGWDFRWGWAPESSAFILSNLYDYYKYSNNYLFLKNDLYPLIKDLVSLYSDLVIPYNNFFVLSPSYSPEHGDITMGNTYQNLLLYNLFSIYLNNFNLENDKSNYLETLKIKDRLLYLEVGKNGQLKEWFNEDYLNKKDLKHRHISHLVGLYPLDLIKKSNYKIRKAIFISLKKRGLQSTGWGLIHRLLCYARLNKSKICYKLINNIIKNNTYLNLWSFHPPFQIDGNLGYSTAILELLVQDYDNEVIELLPALPKKWRSGNVSGVALLNNKTIDIKWHRHKVIEILLNIKTNQNITINTNKFKSLKFTITNSNNNLVNYKIEKGVLFIFNIEGILKINIK